MAISTYSVLLSFPSSPLPLAIAKGFHPERNSRHEKKAKTTVKVKNNSLHVSIQSTENSALRASVLSAVELLDLAIRLA